MTLPAPPTGLYPEDYDKIEAAVMETVRGRWFLLEYARRQRAAETERLVQAVDRLERYAAARMEESREPTPEAQPDSDWRLPRRLAERAREFAQTLRASGLDETLCAQADALADQFVAYAGAAPAAALSTPEAPKATIAAFDAPVPAPVEAIADDETECEAGAAQGHAAESREPEGRTGEIVVDPRLAALSRLDHLPLNEKLRFFG